MGVINVTPNSFSDGGETYSPESIQNKLTTYSTFDAIDIGAESTAPMNASVPWEVEWERWKVVLPLISKMKTTLSVDTYHPETIFKMVKFWQDQKLSQPLIWNDVSGKFDDYVKEFLKSGHDYVFCHNLAPTRELSGSHMEYVSYQMDLKSYFLPHVHPQVIFDPCLGFSKSFEQNWQILDGFSSLQEQVPHQRWLLGFSRKSFLKKKYQTQDREKLDQVHLSEVKRVLQDAKGEVWIRTHRPELLSHG